MSSQRKKRVQARCAAQHDVEAVDYLAPSGRSVGRSSTSGRWADGFGKCEAQKSPCAGGGESPQPSSVSRLWPFIVGGGRMRAFCESLKERYSRHCGGLSRRAPGLFHSLATAGPRSDRSTVAPWGGSCVYCTSRTACWCARRTNSMIDCAAQPGRCSGRSPRRSARSSVRSGAPSFLVVLTFSKGFAAERQVVGRRATTSASFISVSPQGRLPLPRRRNGRRT